MAELKGVDIVCLALTPGVRKRWCTQGGHNLKRIAIDRRADRDTILARPSQFTNPNTDMITACKHTKVRVVAREEDAEFVECVECGEVFDSDEFRDMAIEEAPAEDEDI
jgi:Zn ribbon nucleic-acid-binding protein